MARPRAIEAGTMVNAAVMGWQDRITSTSAASMPTSSRSRLNDITELQRVKFQMKGGRIVRRLRLRRSGYFAEHMRGGCGVKTWREAWDWAVAECE